MLGSGTGVPASDAATLPRNHDALERQVEERTAALRESEAALRESEVWLAAQKEAFKAAINGAPLEESLGILVRTAVAHWGGEIRSAFYIADAACAELHHVTGMAESYAECVDGFKIGPDSLACGLAVYTGQPVITADVSQAPEWKDWVWLAERYRFRGCWSFPIETSAGKVVGTFAMYFESAREAAPRDYAAAAVLTRTAAIIISRQQEAEERARAVEALRASAAARGRRARSAAQGTPPSGQEQPAGDHQPARDAGGPSGASAGHLLAGRGRQPRRHHRVDSRVAVPVCIALGDRSVGLCKPAGGPGPVLLPARFARQRLGDRRRHHVDLARGVPLGLVITELVSNACKHAFPGETEGRLEIRVADVDGRIHVQVKDTGVGLPAAVDQRPSETLGLQLVQMLSQQLGGSVAFESAGGTTVDVSVPRKAGH